MKRMQLLGWIVLLGALTTACATQPMQAEPAMTPETPAMTETIEMEELPMEAEAMAAEYHMMSAKEAKARMDSGDKIVILDVRRQDEYDEKHIPGAILLPNESIGTERPEQLPDLDAEILVYCRSGNRSRQAAEKLVAMGYTAVYDFGGINSWPYETEGK